MEAQDDLAEGEFVFDVYVPMSEDEEEGSGEDWLDGVPVVQVSGGALVRRG
jgi:hypothetical protein